MDDLLTKQNISVETDFDRVVLTFNRSSFLIPYAEGFKISSGIASGCRESMRLCREPRKNWRDWMVLDGEIDIPEVSPKRRHTITKKFDWRVVVNGELIHLWMGNNGVGFHFESGFKISAWLRLASKQAKHWAGDTGKSMYVTGWLTDAEQIYKTGLN